jgi:hypothetical protein
MEALRYSETLVLIKTTRRNIPEADILHSHCRENLKSNIDLSFIQTNELLRRMVSSGMLRRVALVRIAAHVGC